jgi:hypothetical protein
VGEGVGDGLGVAVGAGPGWGCPSGPGGLWNAASGRAARVSSSGLVMRASSPDKGRDTMRFPVKETNMCGNVLGGEHDD